MIFAALFMSLSGSYRLGFELRGTTDSVSATVNDVLADSPAEAAGVQAGDRILAINGKRVDGDSIRPTIQARAARRDADGRARRKDRAAAAGPAGEVGGVRRRRRDRPVVPRDVGGDAGDREVGRPARDRRRPRRISSPVGIVQGSSEAVEQGTDTYLWVLGLISLSLALLNLLPLLPLDGGHIAFSLIEGIRGQAVAREVYERVSVVGIAVVLLLFFIGLTNDIGRSATSG